MMVLGSFVPTVAFAETSLTIATVNNGDMITMQKMTDDFTKANPDIKLNWVTLEENDLRQKVTRDIATKGGQFDIMTIGMFETPIWGAKGWLTELNHLDDPKDFLPANVSGLSANGKLYLLIHVTQSKLAVDTALARFGPPHRSSVESSMPDRSVG